GDAGDPEDLRLNRGGAVRRRLKPGQFGLRRFQPRHERWQVRRGEARVMCCGQFPSNLKTSIRMALSAPSSSQGGARLATRAASPSAVAARA
ncbi:MAG: hypothetical protein V4653_15150, partial [Pseudomonadota bacterium]